VTIGVDVGGTFTDCVWWDGERLHAAKVTTTPNQSDGVAAGIERLRPAGRVRVLHGTTVATNTLLQRSGARTVLVVDAGCEDLIEIARQDRPSLYDAMADRPAALVTRGLRVGWDRSVPVGQVTERIASLDPEAVAVSMMWSYRDPGPEAQLAAALARRSPGLPVSLSHLVSGEFREYERASTTTLNAYLQPAVSRYLETLGSRLPAGVLVMRSSGGLTSTAAAAANAASIVLSGPAGGVVAAAALGSAHGFGRVISFDMGGTSTDVCRIEEGQPEIGTERTIDGIVCRLPAVAVHTIGAGGGSLAWRDPGGSVRVGPQSAGAHPGPACYGRGGMDATVTDAHALLGRIGPEQELGGALRIDRAAARAALERLGRSLGLDARATATGVIEVVDAHMERALRAVTIEQGADPRQAALVAFGGAGGLHAGGLARRLEMPSVLVPPLAGVFSALGLLLSPPRHDRARSVMLEAGRAGRLDPLVSAMVAATSKGFESEIGDQPTSLEVVLDVRYRGQSHETLVPYRVGEGWDRLASQFHAIHQTINGFSRPEDPIEVVTVRATALGRPVLRWDQLDPPPPNGPSLIGERTVLIAGGEVTARRFRRSGLGPGDRVAGPGVIEEPEATIWVAPDEQALVLDDGTLQVTW
jgi:N-methylhydantoinase A